MKLCKKAQVHLQQMRLPQAIAARQSLLTCQAAPPTWQQLKALQISFLHSQMLWAMKQLLLRNKLIVRRLRRWAKLKTTKMS